jgi:hypothetical protein
MFQMRSIMLEWTNVLEMAKIGSLRRNALRKIGHDLGFINSNTQYIFNG